MNILPIILRITLPLIQKLIQSHFVPTIKRQAYEFIDDKSNELIEDLAQNATKITQETNKVKKLAYIEGTKLGIDTLRALANKFNKAADEIEKVII